MDCFEEFKKIISAKTKKADQIKLGSQLRELGLDSLDLLEIVTEGEEKLKIRFEDEELSSFKTVGDVVKAAEGKLK